jgi:hypothetical protein
MLMSNRKKYTNINQKKLITKFMLKKIQICYINNSKWLFYIVLYFKI